jgi:hypothetical protein
MWERRMLQKDGQDSQLVGRWEGVHGEELYVEDSRNHRALYLSIKEI